MMKKYIIISLFLLLLTSFCYLYIKTNNNEKVHVSHTQKVAFLNEDNKLIPISIDLINHNTPMNMIYNKVDIMKSKDFISRGLYPVYDSSLEILDVDIKSSIVNLHLYIDDEKKINMRMIESLCFIMDDMIEKFNLDLTFHKSNKLDSAVIKSIRGLNESFGMNNFTDVSQYIHESIPVEIYKDIYINDIKYYMPITYRINSSYSIEEKIELILKEVDKTIILDSLSINNNILSIELDNNILNDNEKIDLDLETKIVLSLMSLSDYDSISLMIDGENVRNINDSNIAINYFYLS